MRGLHAPQRAQGRGCAGAWVWPGGPWPRAGRRHAGARQSARPSPCSNGPWALILCLAFLGGCARTPDGELIAQNLDSMAEAAERRDLRAVLRYVAEDFRGNEGIDRAGLAQLVALELRRNRRIGVVLTKTEIDALAPTAAVRVQLALTGGAGALPERARYYRVESHWRKRDGEWYVVEASWQVVIGLGGG